MSRPRYPHHTMKWNIAIPAPLAARVEQLFLDPLTQKPHYGERSRVIASLLEQYMSSLSGRLAGEQVVVPLVDAPHIIYDVGGRVFSYTELRRLLPKEPTNA